MSNEDITWIVLSAICVIVAIRKLWGYATPEKLHQATSYGGSIKDGLTQEKVDEVYAVMKEKWDQGVKKSGKSESVLIATDTDARVAIIKHAMVQKDLLENGLILPDLTDIKITVEEVEDSGDAE